MIVWFGLILPILFLRAPNSVLCSPFIVPLEKCFSQQFGGSTERSFSLEYDGTHQYVLIDVHFSPAALVICPLIHC